MLKSLRLTATLRGRDRFLCYHCVPLLDPPRYRTLKEQHSHYVEPLPRPGSLFICCMNSRRAGRN